MRVRSYRTGGEWLSEKGAEDEDQNLLAAGDDQQDDGPDKARQDIDRVLSDILRSHNLNVLSGLGTSLCVDGAPTMGNLWDAVKDSYEQVQEGRPTWAEVLQIARHPEDNEDIEELLSRCKSAEAFETGDAKANIRRFVGDAEAIIRDRVDFLAADPLPTHEAFLRRLARRSVRRDRLKLFTTNYDRCFEHAAQRGGFVVIDGFSFSQPSVFDPMHFSYDIVRRGSEPDAPDYIENLFHLYKIHGSIDWQADEVANRIQKFPKTKKPLLIYPRNTKYELAFAQPYLEMMSSFQASIRQRDVGLFVVGFGFNDNHIAEPILAAIETNLAMKAVVIAPGLEQQAAQNAHLKKMVGLIDRGDTRLALVDATFEDIVPILPDVTAMTDLERHVDRVRAVRES